MAEYASWSPTRRIMSFGTYGWEALGRCEGGYEVPRAEGAHRVEGELGGLTAKRVCNA